VIDRMAARIRKAVSGAGICIAAVACLALWGWHQAPPNLLGGRGHFAHSHAQWPHAWWIAAGAWLVRRRPEQLSARLCRNWAAWGLSGRLPAATLAGPGDQTGRPALERLLPGLHKPAVARISPPAVRLSLLSANGLSLALPLGGAERCA